jgi:hypothetical protein
MIVEGVDALKGTIRPLSLDHPLIAVNEDNVKDRLLRALGHPDAIPAQKRQFGDDPIAWADPTMDSVRRFTIHGRAQ